MLTKGNFTRDEWDHLLRFLNIVNLSMFSCSHFLSEMEQSVMSKRVQESTLKEGRQWRSRDPRIWYQRTCWVRRKPLRKNWVILWDQHGVFNSQQETGAKHQPKPSNVLKRQHDDTQTSSTRKLGLRDESSKSARARRLERCEVRIINSEGWSGTSTTCRSSIIDTWRMSSSISKKQVNLAEDAPVIGIDALKTNVLIWGFFVSTTMKVAIHLGHILTENVEMYKNTNFEELTQKMVLHHQMEILNVKTIEWTSLS